MTTLRLQLKSWQSSLPHQAEHATSCLQVKAVRIRTGSAFVRIPLHLHHSETILQKLDWWNPLQNMPFCCTGEKLAKYFCPSCPRNLPFTEHPLPLTGLEQCPASITHFKFFHGLYTRGVYWPASTPKQAWQIPSILKAEAHSWLQPMLF